MTVQAALREETQVERRYRERIATIWERDVQKLSNDSARSALLILADARRELLDNLARLDPSDVRAIKKIVELRKAIDRTTTTLSQQLSPTLGRAIDGAWLLGASLLPRALEGLGAGVAVAREIPTEALVIAREIGGDLVRYVSEDFRTRTRQLVARGAMGALSPFAMQRQVYELLRTEPDRQTKRLGTLAYQAERIVRTEISGVANIANKVRHDQIAEQVPGLTKYWLTAHDGRVRDSHVTAGRRYSPGGSPGPIPVDEDYEVGGFKAAAPHDPRLPARERLLCRCISVLYSPAWFGREVQEATITEHLPGKHRQKDHAGKGAADNPRGDIRAEFDAAENKAAHAFLIADLKAPDGSPVRAADETAAYDRLRGQVKDGIVRKIDARVKDNPAIKDAILRGKAIVIAASQTSSAVQQSVEDVVQNYKDGSISADKALSRVKQAGVDIDEVRYNAINATIGQWAETSADSNRRAVAMQLAAKEEFGLKDATTGHYPSATVREAETHRNAAAKVILRAQYEITQEALKKAGIEYVMLYRGVKAPKDSAFARRVERTPGVTEIDLQPASSFSVDSHTARSFAGYPDAAIKPVVIAARIHRSQVLATARTGFGCLAEGEYVVLGGKGRAVAWSAPGIPNIGAYLQNNFGIKIGRDMQEALIVEHLPGKHRQKDHAGKGGPALQLSEQRAFDGQPVALRTKLTKQEVGRLGEDIAMSYLRTVGKRDVRLLNAKLPNFAVDLAHDHEAVEIKTGLVSNGLSAQHWRATIGQPGKIESAWLRTASSEEKAAWNKEKSRRILQRKQQALDTISKEIGQPMRGRTVTLLLDPDRGLVDIYNFEGFHDRIGWKSTQARQGYVGSYRYGKSNNANT